ncbi:universal stress protein [Streptomyces sp. SID8382]|uniref:universal stress protein n=1 Tax=Streptomyces malaysiensis TaxID=92644 RepID=UPI000C2B5F12|nr:MULTISPECIES: universal stress protein [unclassified Streptomyces]AUA10269.1 Universal stress protein [Streptomyces sp. M56]MYX60661.1 universal stress protein [Streptomyces sp. SID8382]
MEQVVTVGLDGSAESLAAAHWAADEAERRQLALRLTHAWILLCPATPDSPAADEQNYWAKRIVRDAHTELARDHPELTIIEDLVADEAEKALLDAAARSRMLVLGSRGLDRVASFFLGDIGLYTIARAKRPVVLMRAGRKADGHRRHVVVGLSLHGPQDNLLEFAYVTAFTRDVPLHAVHGRRPERARGSGTDTDSDVARETAEQARREMDEVLRPWREKFPRVKVVDEVRLESPAQAIVEAAADSDLLMVGRRKRPPALGPRLGPVVQAAVHHADCPVAVVPHE